MGLRAVFMYESRGNSFEGCDHVQPRVLVAVAAPLMRAAAEACLREHGFTVLAGGADAVVVIQSALREQPDLVLLDADLAGGGIRAAAEISSLAPVVMLADAPTDADVVEAIRIGAVGCLSKDISLQGLARALSGVLRGETAVPRGFVSAVLSEALTAAARPLLGRARLGMSDLSLRELEVLRLLAGGSSTADIARTLSISPITARRHCAGICKKLKVRDRATAVELVKSSRLPLAYRAG
jgi:DNA-binding NarL/FixJ family response regulator